jgi:hypothetical protein
MPAANWQKRQLWDQNMTEMAFCAHIGRLETIVDPSSSTILDQFPAGV